MESVLAILAGGCLLGLAGSLHCACMCGGIASGALFLIDPGKPAERMLTLLSLQAGRILTYSAAGAAVAGITSLAVDPQATATSFRVLQWIAAVMLMWMGLATAGLLPRLALPTGTGTRAADLMSPLAAKLRSHPKLAGVTLGMSWGLTPCPMVYAALIAAPLAGSAAMGGLWMLGFGLGTLPGVLSAALGVDFISRLRKGPAAEFAAGLLVAGFGFATLYFSAPIAKFLCLPG